MIRRRIIVFAKALVAGQVKTRLIPVLGAHRACGLARAMLVDTVRTVDRLRRPGLDAELSFDRPFEPDPELARLCSGWSRSVQAQGDLGERLREALARSRRDAARATVVIGSDSPTLPGDRLLRALDALARGAEAVVGPSRDGGYALIGTTADAGALFREIPWGTPEVLVLTRARAREAGIELIEVPGWDDVDTPADLERLERELSGPPARERAPTTAAWIARHRARPEPADPPSEPHRPD